MAALHQTLRSLRRTPGFTLTAVLTLAVGIAAVGAMFAVVYGVLLAPLPFAEPERLVSVGLRTADGNWVAQPLAVQTTYGRLAQTLDGIGFYRTGNVNISSDGEGTFADSVIGTWITASTLPMLRATPLLGRNFEASEELRGGPQAVILSEAEWRSRYHAAPDVIGKTLVVNSVRRQIIGVLPAQFTFPLQNAATRVWLPAKRIDGTTIDDFAYTAVARLRAGVDPKQAQRELAMVLPRVADAFPRLDSGASTVSWLAEAGPTPVVEPLRARITGSAAGLLWLAAGAASLVLLVAWANVGSLLLIRADARQPEFALRAALGANRLRTVGHACGEALWLAGLAGVVALPLAGSAVALLVAFGPVDFPRLGELAFAAPTVVFVAVTAAASAVVCAAVPAIAFWRARLSPALHEGGRGASVGIRRLRLRAGITVLQIAVAMVVTIGSSLLARSAYRLGEVHPGFDADQVMVLRTQLPYGRYHEADALAFYARLVERVRQLPTVEHAGLGRQVPLGRRLVAEVAFRSDHDDMPRSLPLTIADAGYFDTLSIPVFAGRGFRPITPERDNDVMISRLAAEMLFGDPHGATAVGRTLTVSPSGPTYTVAGVVGDLRDHDLQTAPTPIVYRPPSLSVDPQIEPEMPHNMALFVRSRRPGDALVDAIRHIVRELDPAVPVYDAQPMHDIVRASMARLTLTLVLISAAAAITLLLGTVGLYGVMATMVAMRRREFGVRVALGAGPSRIARLVAMRAVRLTAAGTALGLVAYAMLAPLLRAWLFEVTTSDPATLLAATMLLVASAALASWLPARLAARVEPACALRAE